MPEIRERPYTLLLHGHDTVECCYYLRASVGNGFDVERLTAQREGLRQSKTKDPLPVTLGGMEFLLLRYGSSRGFPLVLSNADFSIEYGEYNDPSFYVTYRSEALWREGAFALHRRFLDWALSLRFYEYRLESLSRVDWTFDYHLPVVDFDEDNFVTLADKDSKHRKNREAQGFNFGVGDVRLRMYDKVAEIQEESLKVWFYDLWRRDSQVWRIEWQARKDLLRRFGIRTLADLQDLQGDALRYLAHEHDTLRVKTDDSNRSRWPLHPLWVDLHEQIKRFDAQGVVRVVNAKTQLAEREMRIAISIYGNMKQLAALDCVRHGQRVMPRSAAVKALETYLVSLHDPLTWLTEVAKRVKLIELGQ